MADTLTMEMTRSPQKCFCKYPVEDLKDWIVKKYQRNLSTIELLKSTRSQKDKEEIGIVALLDVEDIMVLHAMRGIDDANHNILGCRNHVLKAFEHMKL